MASNKDGAFCKLPGAEDIETDDAAIKLLTRKHSDMAFMNWPQQIPKNILVYGEGKRDKNKKLIPTASRKQSEARYRHYMITDDPDKLPFSEIGLANSVSSPLPDVESSQNAAHMS